MHRPVKIEHGSAARNQYRRSRFLRQTRLVIASRMTHNFFKDFAVKRSHCPAKSRPLEWLQGNMSMVKQSISPEISSVDLVIEVASEPRLVYDSVLDDICIPKLRTRQHDRV
jgi:hypothetical protein